jgi:SAM-dependent methyltransferase
MKAMKRRRLLDPREVSDAVAAPIADAVNIPWSEIPRRMHELPPPDEILRMPDLTSVQAAAERLQSRGRRVELVPFAYGESGRGRLWEPNPFLAEIAPHLPPGRALDVGCGAGRDAVFLASLGWSVLAVDVLPDAIERGRDLAARYLDAPERIEWSVADIRRESPSGAFDLVTMFAFLHRPLLRAVPDLLAPGGSLVLETFTTEHRARHGRPASPELALAPEEIGKLVPGLTVREANVAWRGLRHTGRLWVSR